MIRSGAVSRAEVIAGLSREKLLGWSKAKSKKINPKLHTDLESDYPPFLLSVASAVRTGLDPLEAIRTSSAVMRNGALKKEFSNLVEMIAEGKSEEAALNEFATRVGTTDAGMFADALIIARRTGSSLGPTLRRLARVTRARQGFRRKAKSAIAMQKLSAFFILCFAVASGAAQIILNHQAFLNAVSTPVGGKLFFAGVAFLSIGAFLITRLGRTRFR